MRKNKQVNLPAASIVGGAGAMLIAFLLSMILAWLGTKMILSQDSVQRSVPIVLAASVFLAAWISAARVPKKTAVLAVLGTAAVYCILMLCIKLIFFKGAPVYFTRNLVFILIGSASAFLVMQLTKGRKKYHSTFRRR